MSSTLDKIVQDPGVRFSLANLAGFSATFNPVGIAISATGLVATSCIATTAKEGEDRLLAFDPQNPYRDMGGFKEFWRDQIYSPLRLTGYSVLVSAVAVAITPVLIPHAFGALTIGAVLGGLAFARGNFVASSPRLAEIRKTGKHMDGSKVSALRQASISPAVHYGIGYACFGFGSVLNAIGGVSQIATTFSTPGTAMAFLSGVAGTLISAGTAVSMGLANTEFGRWMAKTPFGSRHPLDSKPYTTLAVANAGISACDFGLAAVDILAGRIPPVDKLLTGLQFLMAGAGEFRLGRIFRSIHQKNVAATEPQPA